MSLFNWGIWNSLIFGSSVRSLPPAGSNICPVCYSLRFRYQEHWSDASGRVYIAEHYETYAELCDSAKRGCGLCLEFKEAFLGSSEDTIRKAESLSLAEDAYNTSADTFSRTVFMVVACEPFIYSSFFSSSRAGLYKVLFGRGKRNDVSEDILFLSPTWRISSPSGKK
jgi:hypothetical protein